MMDPSLRWDDTSTQKTTIMQNTKNISEIFRRFEAENPQPKTELTYTNNFTLLVAVILSAQATDKGVNKATPALFKVADTPAKMAALGVAQIEEYIKNIGLFRSKAKNIIAMSNQLLERHNGQVPEDRQALEALAGVGSKTAAVLLNCAFGHSTIAVDTHVYRVSNRIGLCNTKTPEQTEAALLKIIPEKYLFNAHHWLILHGRYTCTARNPKCGECVVNDLCENPKVQWSS
jgi:endonuclease III